ncbi:hypothetical protein LCGC14_0326050 [marine sediment metagenome]|uniref:Uncharacterized protein n=1 Tax=marine sediment metagenome TaxID=412755 RepID=A0A0F9TNF7_9ZZZZ
MAELRWQKSPPDEPGDWLWVENTAGRAKRGGFCSVAANGAIFFWSSTGEPIPLATTAWAKIELPCECGDPAPTSVTIELLGERGDSVAAPVPNSAETSTD